MTIAPALIAVDDPAGTDDVVFQYHGYDSYPELIALSVLTFAILALTPLAMRRTKRRRASTGSRDAASEMTRP